MATFFKWLAICFACSVLLLLGVAWLAIETSPAVEVSATRQINDADSVNNLLKQVKQINQMRYVHQTVLLSQEQLNSLAGFAQRAIPEFAARLDTQPKKLVYEISYQLPLKGTHLYLNLRGGVLEGNRLRLEEVHLGSLSLDGDTALGLIEWLINWRTDSDIGSVAIGQVDSLAMFADKVIVTLKPVNELLTRLNQIKKGLTGNENQALRIRTAHYISLLNSLEVAQANSPSSLVTYIRPLFAEATRRSQVSDAQPATENEAAILALAIYTGHHRLANLVGDVQPYHSQVVLPRYRPVLARRTDLTQHFVISAAIKVLAMQGVSNAIGEFKELMDRGQGGSGFSFADLAADMAGVELAVRASDPQFAGLIQQRLAKINDEAGFFPSIEGLPEGLSKAQFTAQFGEVESAAYQHAADRIRDRIAALPLYSDLQ